MKQMLRCPPMPRGKNGCASASAKMHAVACAGMVPAVLCPHDTVLPPLFWLMVYITSRYYRLVSDFGSRFILNAY